METTGTVTALMTTALDTPAIGNTAGGFKTFKKSMVFDRIKLSSAASSKLLPYKFTNRLVTSTSALRKAVGLRLKDAMEH